MAGLAAAGFYATGHHGVIVNATGEAGASKSTSLYTAASMWGQPELYPINGTNNGATVRGRNERVTVLANLPVCVDEITHMPVKDAVDLAMSITQPGHRIRLETSGVERSSVDSYKATIMLTTANTSLHGLLSTDNAAGTAGSMRVVELQFKRQHVHTKAQADDYIHDLMQNYGHIGEQVVAHILQHKDEFYKSVRAEMRALDEECNIQPSERFWSSTGAAVVAVTRIANKLGLVTYDAERIRQWYVAKQIPEMRGVVVEEYSSPIGALADYLEHINGNILVVTQNKATGFGGNAMVAIKEPRGELLARFEQDSSSMWVAIKGFKDWCTRQGLNHRKVLDDLSQSTADANGRKIKVIVSRDIKKVLGAGTEFAKAQSRSFVINMDHPDVRGAIELEQDTTPVVKGKAHLRVV
jgi:hypothetical protein